MVFYHSDSSFSIGWAANHSLLPFTRPASLVAALITTPPVKRTFIMLCSLSVAFYNHPWTELSLVMTLSFGIFCRMFRRTIPSTSHMILDDKSSILLCTLLVLVWSVTSSCAASMQAMDRTDSCLPTIVYLVEGCRTDIGSWSLSYHICPTFCT